jgi:flagellar motor switch/type III secretory pathway protein FliN
MMAETGAVRAASEAVPAAANPELERTLEAAEDGRWRRVLVLPCELTVDLPLPGFRIADLLKLRPGSVINAHWPLGREVPLRLNGVLIGWSEFAVVGNSLAVRLTELAGAAHETCGPGRGTS